MINRHSRAEMLKTGVYEIIHIASGKRYVGSAAYQFGQRLRAHRSSLNKGLHSSVLLQRAWNKYGEEAFEFRILEFTLPEHAVAVEQTFIDWRQSANPKNGYNISPTAGNCRGIERSELTREKIRQSTKRQFADPVKRARHCEIQKKRCSDPENRARVGKQFRDYYANPDNRNKVRERIAKSWENPQKRIDHSDLQKKRLADPSVRRKQRDSAKRRWSNPEERKANAERVRKIVGTPEAREAAREKTKAINADPERKAIMQAKNRATRAAKKNKNRKMKQGVLFEC